MEKNVGIEEFCRVAVVRLGKIKCGVLCRLVGCKTPHLILRRDSQTALPKLDCRSV
jgi:hypothetical protein